MKFTQDFSAQISSLREALQNIDAVIIGAGAGLFAAVFTCSGEQFHKYFWGFEKNTAFTICIRAGFIRMIL